jgi:8-oxo-dGTP pyrophosphatase MutT (NUDIX family)
VDFVEVLRQAAAFEAAEDGLARKSQELLLALLRHTKEPFSRLQFTPGHVTCTGLVMSPSRREILLVHHFLLDRWLLPGGHIESGDETPAGAARREVIEETAVALDRSFTPVLVGIDVHGIPERRGEPFHLHHDLIFAFRAGSARTSRSAESRDVRWAAPGEFQGYRLPHNVIRAFERAQRIAC